MRKLIKDFLGRPAPTVVQPYLQVLDCSDMMELASMYGEARHRGDANLMKAIDARMSVVIEQEKLAPPGKEGV